MKKDLSDPVLLSLYEVLACIPKISKLIYRKKENKIDIYSEFSLGIHFRKLKTKTASRARKGKLVRLI